MKKQIGISIIVIGFIISLASPYTVMIIGVPTFILGVILLWISKTNKRTKIIWSLVPPILWIPLTTLWLFMYNSIGKMNAQKRDYYISEDFKGAVVIVESKCGNEPILKDDRLQFEIPKTGVYLFNGELKSGHIDRRIFLKKENGELKQLNGGIWPTKSEEKDTTGSETVTGFWGGTFGTRYDQSNSESNFTSINIETNKVYTDKQIWKMNKNQDDLIDILITKCKK